MMKHGILLFIALILVFGPASAGIKNNGRDYGESGVMSQEELCREPVLFELDIPYADPGDPRHRLDLYIPKDPASDKLPVIVFFHGGGWVQGDKSSGAGKLMPFLRTGQYAGVCAGYRLSGEAQWPAQIHDCKAVIRWVRAHAKKYGLDPDHIGVWGLSAGGHLALMVGLSADVPELEGSIGRYRDVSSKVACVVNFFGESDLLAAIGQPSDIDRTRPDAPEALLIGEPLKANPQKARSASPVTYVSANDPPVLTVHGTDDLNVPYDQALRLDAALRKAGVPSYLITVEGGGHGDFNHAADERVKAFFGKYLYGRSVEVLTDPITFPGREQHLRP